MSRPFRNTKAGLVYHALNRANARLPLFDDEADYEVFARVLRESIARDEMRLLAYCVMPKHFHLVLWTHHGGSLSQFMRWLTMRHTQRWHAHRHTAGAGHLDQGRFKSFPVQDDGHFLTVCRYVERNALRAGLVPRAELWRWGSLSRLDSDSEADRTGPTLSEWPIGRPDDWVARVNLPFGTEEEKAVQTCIHRGQPFGSPDWRDQTAARLRLGSTLR